MSLRRKSTGKSSSKRPSRTVAHPTSTSPKRGTKPSKRASIALIDSNLDQFLDPSLELTPPLTSPVDESDSAFQKVEEAKQALGNLECEIISALFPSSGDPESFESLALRLGMSVKEVREVADNALRGLRGTKSGHPRSSSVWN